MEMKRFKVVNFDALNYYDNGVYITEGKIRQIWIVHCEKAHCVAISNRLGLESGIWDLVYNHYFGEDTTPNDTKGDLSKTMYDFERTQPDNSFTNEELLKIIKQLIR